MAGMNIRSLSCLLILMFMPFVCATMAHAEIPVKTESSTSSPADIKKEMEQIGAGLNDDRTDMYDRYVYDDAQTVDKKVPLNLPVLPNQDIQEWLSVHIAQIMTVNPTFYPMHIKRISPLFVVSGLDQFQQQWANANIPDLIANQNYSMTAMVINVPQIVAKGRQKNIYRWIADVPVLLTYSKGTESKAYDITLRVGLTRIPMQEDTRLIAIDQWGVAPKPPAKPNPKDEKPKALIY